MRDGHEKRLNLSTVMESAKENEINEPVSFPP